MSLADISKNLEKAQRIKAALTTLKNELVSSYDSFKGTELEGPIGELMVHSFNYLKELPGEVATPATPEGQSPNTNEEAEKPSIGARLGKEQQAINEAVKKGAAHYFDLNRD